VEADTSTRRRPSLSVCCLCDRAGAQVAAALRPLRRVAGEIVVAVDERLPFSELPPLAAVADRLLRVQLGDWREQAWTWLHRQCTGDWILRVDPDETCGPELLAALPELIDARDVRQYWIHRRWLWPDPGHWLSEWPWSPDAQCRLYRNDGELFFSGRALTGAEPCFPSRDVLAPIYKLDCLVTSAAGRTAAAERYLGMDAAHRDPIRERDLRALFLPEHYAGRAPVALSANDRRAVEDVLAGPAREYGDTSVAPVQASGDTSALPAVPVAEVLRHWAGRKLTDAAYRALLVPLDGYRVLRAGEERPFHVLVTNQGEEEWPGGGWREPQIRPSYHWCDADGQVIVFDGARTALPGPVAPGETCRIPVKVVAPRTPGSYRLRFDLVHEHRRWFDQPSPDVSMTVLAA
jgi:hypothetical protein